MTGQKLLQVDLDPLFKNSRISSLELYKLVKSLLSSYLAQKDAHRVPDAQPVEVL